MNTTSSPALPRIGEGRKIPFVLIEGQEVPWSVVQMVRRACGGDWDQTIDAFWKARKATGKNGIVKYVVRGLVPDKKTGNRYSLLPSKEWNAGEKETVRQWWETCVYQPKPRNDAMSLKEIFRELGK